MSLLVRAGWLVSVVMLMAVGAVLVTPQAPAQPQAAVDQHGDPLPPGAIARLGTLRYRTGAEISSLAVSPDGKLVAGTGKWNASVWELATGKLVHEFPAGIDFARCMFSADGKVLIVAQLGQVDLWNLATGKRVAQFREKKVNVAVAALAPDGKTIALTYEIEQQGNTVGKIKLRAVPSGKEIRTFGDHLHGIDQLAFAPDGKTLLSAGPWSFAANPAKDYWVKRWDVATGKQLGELSFRGKEMARLAFAADGRTVVVCPNHLNADPQLWDTVTGKPMMGQVQAGRTVVLALTPDARKMATLADSNRIKVWNTATGREICQLDMNTLLQNTTLALALTPDGKQLVTAGRHGLVQRWDATTGKEIDPSDAPFGWVGAVAFAPDGKTVATSDGVKYIRLWEAKTGKELRRLEYPGTSRPALAFTLDSKTLISDGGLLWHVATGQLTGRLAPPPAPGEPFLLHPTLSPDGKTVACARGEYEGAEIILFDLATKKELRRFGKNERANGPFAFSPDGKMLASARAIKSVPMPLGAANAAAQPLNPVPKDDPFSAVLLWDVATGKLLAHGAGQGQLRSAVFTPDGKKVLGAVDQRLYAWDATTGKALVTPLLDTTEVAVLPGGKVLALHRWEHALHVWDFKSLQKITLRDSHRGVINRLALSADGKQLATAGNDGTALIWDVAVLSSFKE